MTEKTLDWLNANRFRAYPFVNDDGLVSNGKRIPDCLLLDCLVVDTRHGVGPQELVFTGLDVTAESTTVRLSYGDREFAYSYSGGSTDGNGSFIVVRTPSDPPSPELHFRLVLSSHAYVLAHAGTGSWSFRGRVLPTKVVTSAASGVSGISVNGSDGLSDRGEPGLAKGTVVLRDGYRTMPTISNGRILVRVGTKYGEDPCHHAWPDLQSEDCSRHLLFFCGQHANADGDVTLKGGPGISVSQGRPYSGQYEPCVGMPCIEVRAASELLRIYTPTILVDSSPDSVSSNV